MDPVWTMPYALTRKEAARGMGLACKPIYSGWWKALQVAAGLLMGAAMAALALSLGITLERALGLSVGWWGLYALVLWIGFALVSQGTRNRMSAAYVDSPNMVGQELELSARGITLRNGRSDGIVAWSDIVAVVEAKDMLVASIGAAGFILPNRVLKQAGDPKVIRQQVKVWHAAAQVAQVAQGETT